MTDHSDSDIYEALENIAGQPVMVCPACQEYFCHIDHVDVHVPGPQAGLLALHKQHVVGNRSVIYLLAECPCGAQWAFQFVERDSGI